MTIEFKDKNIDDQYSDLKAEEDELLDQLGEIQDKIYHLVANYEQE